MIESKATASLPITRIKFAWIEYSLPFLGVVLLLISCVIYSSKKYFWLDEIAGWHLTTDPSFSHMLNSLIQKGDSVPPFYHILAWGWVHFMGNSELSLRLFSSVGMCIALVLIWQLVRKAYGYWASAISVFAVFGLSYHLLDQNAEGRFYGLLMTLFALIALEYQALCKAHNVSRRLILATMLTFAAIVMTHPFGFVYSGVTVLALATYDLIHRRLRPVIYSILLASWLVFVPWIGPFRIQTDIIREHMWAAVPNISDLLSMYIQGFSATLPSVLIVLITIQVIVRIRRRRPGTYFAALPSSITLTDDREFLLILAAWLFAVPIFAWLISITITSVFVERYMLPASLAWIIVFAQLCTLLTPTKTKFASFKLRTWQILVPKFVVGSCLAMIIFYPLVRPQPPQPGALDSRYGYENLPIAVMSSDVYLPRSFYASPPSRYFYIQDWEIVSSTNTTALNAIMDYKYLDALQKNYPDMFDHRDHIVPAETFLAVNTRFLVIREPQRRWFEARIMNNPAYSFTILGQTDGPPYAGSLDLILVEKR